MPDSFAVIQPLRFEHRAAALNLVCRHLLAEDPACPGDGAGDLARLAAEVARHEQGDPRMRFCGAMVEGRLVGVGGIAASFVADGVWELGWGVVAPDVRERGIGSALLAWRENYARTQGAELLLLSSGDPTFHARRGYRRIAESENDLLMAKALNGQSP